MLRIFYLMIEVALFLMAKRFIVGDEKLKIPRVGLVNTRIVNFIDDAVADGESEPATGVVSRAHAFFCAGSPARFDSRRAKRR